jgi:hypothetical protein
MLSYGERGLRQPSAHNFGFRVEGPDKDRHVWVFQQPGEQIEHTLIQLSPLQLPFLAAALCDAFSALLGAETPMPSPATGPN